MSEREIRSRLWQAPYRGIRRWSSTVDDPPAAAVAAAAALLPDGCALGGWAAAYHRAIRYLDGDIGFPAALPVPLMLSAGHQLRWRPGIRPIRTEIAPQDTEEVDGIRTAVLVLAGLQAMCMARGLVEAVVVADMVTSVRTGEPTIAMADLAKRVAGTNKVRGIVQARAALELASDRSASPEETCTRMVWVLEAHLPPPLVNAPIFDLRGRLLGLADLVDAEAGQVHEVDGAQHRGLDQHTSDNAREEAFERHGLVVSRSTSRDRADRSALGRRMCAMNEQGLARDRSKDAWTLTAPDGWQEPPPIRRSLLPAAHPSLPRA